MNESLSKIGQKIKEIIAKVIAKLSEIFKKIKEKLKSKNLNFSFKICPTFFRLTTQNQAK